MKAFAKTPAERLATFVADLRFDDLPHDVIAAAKLHALDALGCGLAARAFGEVSWMVQAAAEVAISGGPATAIGLPGGLPAADAALLNGTLCHALDFDDTHPDAVVHVSASVVPAALAVAETLARSGRDLICGLVAGNEASIRLGMAGGGLFHARGFHPTGVCGVFGATAAAARLRGLNAHQTGHALGLAGSMAGGLLEFLADGSNTKPLHPGWAAHAGLMAARLAAHGATGPRTVLDGERGFFGAYLHGEHTDVQGQVADLGARWETPRIAYKPYPVCHYIHAPLDALAQLVAREGLTAGDVRSIVAVSDDTGVDLVLSPLEDKLVPRNPYDAKFSLPYCLATWLVKGKVDATSFTREAIADPAVLEIAARVSGDTKAYAPRPDAFPGGVRVLTSDGRTLQAELRYQRGGVDNPMTVEEILNKYRSNAKLALSPTLVRELERALLALEAEGDLRALKVLARRPDEPPWDPAEALYL